MEKADFEKKFRNYGFDKESVLKAGTKDGITQMQEQKQNQRSDEKDDTPKETGQASFNEIEMLKRKFEYFNNTTLKELNQRFDEIEKKIEAGNRQDIDYRRDFTQLKNELTELKSRLNSASVVFGENTASPAQVIQEKSAEGQPINQRQSSDAEFQPGALKIEKFFDFSNKK